MLPTGDEQAPKAFHIWKAFAIHSPVLPISRILNVATFRKLGPDEIRAYEAPFPNRKYKTAARAFPKLVPVTPNDPATQANRAAWKALEQWKKPFLTTFSNGDPITRGGDKYMQERIPGAQGQPHQTLVGGHFLQEDSPVQFAQAVNNLLAGMD
jgi:haloalkane dehalogenase